MYYIRFSLSLQERKLNMANITPIKDKDGNITSYRFRVYRGKDAEGKQLKPFTKNWKVPDTYKSEKAILKALEKVAGEFEANCKRGDVSVDRPLENMQIITYSFATGIARKRPLIFIVV